MVDQELIERVTRLPVPARLELIELLTHSLRAELTAKALDSEHASAQSSVEKAAESAAQRGAIERLAAALSLDLPPDSALYHLRGVVPAGAVPMTKDEVRALIVESLTEKYS
jgi:hypothetical protein